nr:Ig-like domain-containing protein [uncultured Rhodopila sp.]
MTENRPAPVRATLPRVACIAFLASGALLAACSNPAGGPAGSTQRVYAADVAGAAKVCDAPAVTAAGGATTAATIKVANDGGWCGLRLRQAGTKPFDAGLLLTRPEHGSVLIHEVGDDTRIDYTPDRRFSGSDTFTVKLIPGEERIKVAVTVTAP